MATITEDYVSFETAKLLKEKGFDGHSIITTYDKDAANAYIKELQEKHLPYSSDDPKLKEFYYTMPTLQTAIKWLRIEHNLSVEVYRTACGYIGCIVNIPSGTDIKFLDEDGDDLPSGQYTKWEYACEASIKYCLENLI